MASISYIDHTELRQLMESSSSSDAQQKYCIVDVRDEDFTGGNIKGATNVPSETWTEQSADDLVKRLDGVENVIFHCALSQVRGPKAARRYAEALERSKGISNDLPTADQAKSFAPNPFEKSDGRSTIVDLKRQNVLVLRDGFEGWVGKYRDDPNLVENLRSNRIIR
ncbi:Cdc25 phosphatase Ibp1 [Microbotryomycetes sp. JL201]|nr:Cdc25 phosphatase Ibp1 [Microbotryomycetes sp. JL201]